MPQALPVDADSNVNIPLLFIYSRNKAKRHPQDPPYVSQPPSLSPLQEIARIRIYSAFKVSALDTLYSHQVASFLYFFNLEIPNILPLIPAAASIF